MRAPHKHATRYRGKVVYTFHVTVRQSGVDRQYWQSQATVPVIATSAADACNLIRDEIAARVSHPTEIETQGPKGGVTSRFIGWESLIGARMFASPDCPRLL